MSEHVFITSKNEQIPVIIETKRGIRNITLRPKTNCKHEIHISKPWQVSTNDALNFLESKRHWVECIFANTPQKQKLCNGDKITILGQGITLIHNPQQRGNTFNNAILTIGGSPDMFERRVRDFAKDKLLAEIKAIIKTTPREFWPRRITLRDTTSRWGSCSTTGTMSFSWRLAFAPYDVMRYVVMHELAHTKHMDHSPQFWETVSELYGFGVERARRWLNVHGAELHKYF
ncbi:MAG: M48 family metallopeptidase [Alphaproteobacteria bacterium]